MLNDKWVALQINESRKSHPNVTEAVVIHIKELLSGQFAEQQLTSAELKNISLKLIEEMDPVTSDRGGEQ